MSIGDSQKSASSFSTRVSDLIHTLSSYNIKSLPTHETLLLLQLLYNHDYQKFIHAIFDIENFCHRGVFGAHPTFCKYIHTLSSRTTIKVFRNNSVYNYKITKYFSLVNCCFSILNLIKYEFNFKLFVKVVKAEEIITTANDQGQRTKTDTGNAT